MARMPDLENVVIVPVINSRDKIRKKNFSRRVADSTSKPSVKGTNGSKNPAAQLGLPNVPGERNSGVK